ncbi:MAG: carboxypeptidase-like regulatory domain-containing protein [Proteiniphilum sp.]|nr:carboxypeptidase-like regulatory domain-containing protein [Proteiniphilum sp.]
MNLKDYIRGQRHGKEANQLERKAMDDPFLQDAIDGYDSAKGDHISVIEDLEKRLSSPPKRIGRRVWIWAAAAVIVLLTGIPLLLQLTGTKEEITVASSDVIHHEEESAILLLQEDTILVAGHLELKKKSPGEAPREIIETVEKDKGIEIADENIEMIEKDIEAVEEIESVPDKESQLSTVQPITEETLLREPQKEITGVLTGQTAGINALQHEQDKNIRDEGIYTSSAQPDKILVSGRIVDETGEPITGVTINIPNTLTGTITDTAGNFHLLIPKDEQKTLIASYIGMKKSDIPLKENTGDIMMKADDMALSEVVVVAYGTQRKKSLTGSALKVKKETDRVYAEAGASGRGSVSGEDDAETFGEEKFRKYFTENYDKNICAGQKITIVVEFFIDPLGRPGNINVKENPCPALENEIKRLLLGSPLWSKTNRKVTLQIELP